MIPANEALERLKKGNKHFVARAQGNVLEAEAARDLALPQQQEPFAIILGCSDARVPAEIVFDQGPGDLFVIRVAGNIVAPSQLGSIEFAASRFGTRLVIVLGHTLCGAVDAALSAMRNPQEESSRSLRTIVGFIRPAIENLLNDPAQTDEDELYRQAVRANVAASVKHVMRDSEILTRLITEDGLKVVGAEYNLATGEVHFFDEHVEG
ncbi:carbonic anhydrase [Woeseia oceani]|uniref:Carbonic anhydrase n=1 Tax=Woeseia oceani TaxID=1548547 RepID=A0A193LCT0_9GAMM|nr:carbonic anhydrase [Woeseia oceani]ANO50307.1 carbonic anhydrase [Woeseia oceani]